ncbi:beta-lactamase/transpeptidase-like protein [Kockovaella imperatae]|uniref:Beta-lactamase/transpeptidase-like protein n=1 Tax=Kockovaella imperatae TaxID=4999 RepID=A0A1Y1UGU4_9TREE|nr:beta-lactamase/transpeptidase-like protein [Kockovaella imperatae]ORX36724.1 beta-lactamase/transpeptidase-like protein [Kockovaella imperatae]
MTDTVINDELLGRIQRAFEKLQTPGLALTVVHGKDSGDGIRWNSQIETWGRRNDQGDRFDGQTIFGIGSISKFSAVLCVGLLIDRGTKIADGTKLSWMTRVRSILPWWGIGPYREDGEAFGYDTGQDATLQDLAGMRTGMPIHLAARRPIDPEAALRNQRHLRSFAKMRETFLYNNESIYALAHIVTVFSGTRYPEFVKEHVFDALGHTIIATDGYQRRLVASDSGYTRGLPESSGWWTDTDGKWLYSGGISTTADDLVIFTRELLDPRVLPKAAVESILTPLTCIPSHIALIPGFSTIAMHPGSMVGQSSVFVLSRSLKFGLWAYVNERGIGASILPALWQTILDFVCGLSDQGRLKKLSANPPARPLPDLPAFEARDHETQPKDLVGIYHDPGYGTMTLESFTSAPAEDQRALELGCKGAGLDLDPKRMLFVKHGGFFVHRVVFHHEKGLVYRWITFLCARSSGDYIADVTGTGRAVFVLGDRPGFGMFDGWCDLLGAVKVAPCEDDVAARAETWYDRVA